MIFDPQAICSLAFCQEIDFSTKATLALPCAPFVAVLASSGRAAATACGSALLLCAGSLFLAQGTVEITPATDCHLLALGFGGTAAKAAGESLTAPVLSDGTVCPMAGQLLAEVAAAAENLHMPPQELSSLCYHALCAVAQADALAPTLPPLVAEAVLAMRQNYAGLYGVEELSTQLNVSKSHLVRTFSAAMGVSPGRYLTQVRTEAAKQLLLHREYSLDIVASLCGFSGANYLCKVFKKEIGLSPAAYRTQSIGHAASNAAPSESEQALYL